MVNQKRVFDIIVSLISLLVFAIPFFIVAILIKLDTDGPILYKQIRVGKYNKLFYVYKFRTMTDNADKIGSYSTKMSNDPRITKAGNWIREISIDELTQLVNVIRGEMSIVGPRPDVPLAKKFYLKNEDSRTNVPQGITGYAILKGRSLLSAKERMICDQRYIQDYQKYGFGIDIWIIINTFKPVLSKIGKN